MADRVSRWRWQLLKPEAVHILALRAERFGAPADVIRLDELPDPQPGPGDAVVAIEASPINLSDLLQVRGWYGVGPSLPTIFGNEGAGRVVPLGESVSGLIVADRVLLRPGPPAWAERIKVPAASLTPLPADGDPHQLAMLGSNAPTAYALLGDRALEPGEWVIQNAANSAAGQWVTAFARRRGIPLVDIVRSEDAAAGLATIDGMVTLVDGPDIARRVAAATGNGRITLAVAAVGGEATRALVSTTVNEGSLRRFPRKNTKFPQANRRRLPGSASVVIKRELQSRRKSGMIADRGYNTDKLRAAL